MDGSCNWPKDGEAEYGKAGNAFSRDVPFTYYDDGVSTLYILLIIIISILWFLQKRFKLVTVAIISREVIKLIRIYIGLDSS